MANISKNGLREATHPQIFGVNKFICYKYAHFD